jgi:hypothetical protein
MTDLTPIPDDTVIVDRLRNELAKTEPSRRRRLIEKSILAALGSIPWVGGFLSAAATYKVEEGSLRADSLQTQWLEEHQLKIVALRETLAEIERRFEALGEGIEHGSRANNTLAWSERHSARGMKPTHRRSAATLQTWSPTPPARVSARMMSFVYLLTGWNSITKPILQ